MTVVYSPTVTARPTVAIFICPQEAAGAPHFLLFSLFCFLIVLQQTNAEATSQEVPPQPPKESLQGLRGLRHLPPQARKEPVQGVWRIGCMRAYTPQI